MREFIDGNTAIVRGALAAGCDFFAGYPITPATPILLDMMRDLPRTGGVAIQGEDEIASLGFCIGAAMTGRRAFTATSGPGISLYSENIGLAIMGEVPLVIVDVQRMGPATGGATTAAQGDAQFIRWCTSGGYPIIALCPATVADCYTLTLRAFDLAERFRCPVFLLTDKEVASTMDTVETSDLTPLPVREREVALADRPFMPCDYPAPDENVPMSPFGGPHLLRFTTSTHDERGYLTKDPAKVERLNRHLIAKIEQHRDEIELVRADLEEGADVLLVSFGITARAMDEAVRQVRANGQRVSALTLLSLWPLPESALRRAIMGNQRLHADRASKEAQADHRRAGVRRVVVAELNDGQIRREIERLVNEKAFPRRTRSQGHVEVVGVHRLDGELITPQQILERGGLLCGQTGLHDVRSCKPVCRGNQGCTPIQRKSFSGRKVSRTPVASPPRGADPIRRASTTYLNESLLPFPFCPGCGHHTILKALDRALVSLQWDPRSVVIVTDIGCIGLSDHYFNTHAFHGLHGRSITYATGIKLANPDLHVIVLIGDGGCGIGGNHLLNAARRNVGVCVLVANNFNFGMTGGEHSVLTPHRAITSTTRTGNPERPLDLCATVNVCGAGFVARSTVFDKDLPELISRALQHDGFALVDIWELCTAYFAPNNRFKKRDMLELLEYGGWATGVLAQNDRPEYARAYRVQTRLPGKAFPREVEVLESVSERKSISPRGQGAEVGANACANKFARTRYASPELGADSVCTAMDSQRPTLPPGVPSAGHALEPRFAARLDRRLRVVIAGAAGGKVRSTGHLLGRGAVLSGLYATQRDDYPVTVMSGHSVCEVILDSEPIGYTGITRPDVLILVAEEGRAKAYPRLVAMTPEDRAYVASDLRPTSVWAEDSRSHASPLRSPRSGATGLRGAANPGQTRLHETQARVIHLDFNGLHFRVTRRNRAILALGAVLRREGWYPVEALEAAIRETQREDIAALNLKALQASAALL